MAATETILNAKAKKPHRDDVPKEEVLCRYCTAKCCRYFALPIRDARDWKDSRVHSLVPAHDRASVFVEDGAWYLLVHTSCKHLGTTISAGSYQSRPQICRTHDDKCEYEDELVYDHYFETFRAVASMPKRFCGPQGPDDSTPSPIVAGAFVGEARPSEPGPAGRLGPPPFAESAQAEACISFSGFSQPTTAASAEQRIAPARSKVFRDYLPEAMIPRERLIETARRVYRSYGFSPIDTPALEYLEILAGKGGEETDKQLYKFQDHGGRWVGLRFDLTVPLARFAAEHIGALGTPLKRYHIAPVWRGENTQRGRYREFMQCDFDTSAPFRPGPTSRRPCDPRLVLRPRLDAFTIRVNNAWCSRVAGRLFVRSGHGDLRALDKLAKIAAARAENAAGSRP